MFKIHTLSSPWNSQISYCPERGGIMTSLILHGKEVLFLDGETFEDVTKNVRGGIPLLFPNAGALEDDRYPGLKQHGFARNSSAWKSQLHHTDYAFSETLQSDEVTKSIYPYAFTFSLQGVLEEDGSATLIQEVTNDETSSQLPLSIGLHPYFTVPQNEKGAIQWDFLGGEEVKRAFNHWANGGTTSIPNPGTELRITIPALGTLILKASPEYQRIWIWSLPKKDFICIEPVMRDVGGFTQDPECIPPKGTYSAHVNIKLIESVFKS